MTLRVATKFMLYQSFLKLQFLFLHLFYLLYRVQNTVDNVSSEYLGFCTWCLLFNLFLIILSHLCVYHDKYMLNLLVLFMSGREKMSARILCKIVGVIPSSEKSAFMCYGKFVSNGVSSCSVFVSVDHFMWSVSWVLIFILAHLKSFSLWILYWWRFKMSASAYSCDLSESKNPVIMLSFAHNFVCWISSISKIEI